MRVNVIGLGYIGLPTALIFAAGGTETIGTDINQEIIVKLKQSNLPFHENGLADCFNKAISNGIVFTNKIEKADVYIISVPTPYLKEGKKIDPQYLIAATKAVLKICDSEVILIIESTIPPGTVDKFVRPLVESFIKEYGKKVHIAHAPERIIPGNMIYELEHNSRVIGVDDENVGRRVKALYSTFCKGEIVLTDIRTAEMSKVIENTYRDVNIAFANELAKICRLDNMNVYEIIKIANMHPRVNILQPGPGVGGHCIAVDPWFLVGDYPGLTNIILTARKINDSMPEFVLERIYDIMKENHIDDIRKVGLYGLTYKEDVDDVRESPTLQLLESMEKHLARGIKVFDPFVKTQITGNQYQEFDEFLEGIDLVVIMVAHSHIKEKLDLINKKIVLDTKNITCMETAYRL